MNAISNLGGGNALSNSDFRKFLMTPRATDTEEGSKFAHLDPSRAKAKVSAEQIAEFRKIKQQKKADKMKKKAAQFPEGYRDRAAERRANGEAPEDEETGMSVGLHNMPPPSEDQVDPEELRRQEYERSKYLGGDLAHTHLVKGLDYALLEKVKSELEEEERQKAEEKARQDQEEHSKPFAVKQLITTGGTTRAMEMPTEIKTVLGRNLFREVFLKKYPDTIDTFIQGRTTLLFELDPELHQELPTIVTRSKEDLPAMEELVSGEINPEIIEKVSKIMTVLKHGHKRVKKIEKPEAKPAPVQQKPKVAASIFDDVDDDYSLEEAKDQKPALPPGPSMPGPMMPSMGDMSDYDFSSDAAFENLPPLPKATTATSNKPKIEDKPKEKKKIEDDDYMECYPSTFEGMGFAQGDEEDEEDITKMDTKKKLKRWDFETDEDWIKYEQTREATPKAAYQFGVKMADGRKTKQQKGQKSKINNQLKKIENIWDNKKRKADGGDEGESGGNKRFKAGEFGF
jgi:IK cytokine